MKVGDSLYCYNNDNYWASNLFTVGRNYIITDIEYDKFWVLCDEGLPIYLYLEQKYNGSDSICKNYYYKFYYKLHFRLLCEERRLKLNRLKVLEI